MQRRLSAKIKVMATVLALFLILTGTVASAAGQALQLTAPEHTYAHLYRPFPVQAGNDVSVELSMKVNRYSGSSWAPTLVLYWDPTAYVALGQQGTSEFRVNAAEFKLLGRATVGIPALDWVDVKIGLTPTLLTLAVRGKGGDWVVLQELARPDIPVGLPAEIFVGKGFGNNTPSYPNPHYDNSYTEHGAMGLAFIDNLRVTVDGQVVLHDTFDSLAGWSQHQDPGIESPFALVSEDVANEPFAE